MLVLQQTLFTLFLVDHRTSALAHIYSSLFSTVECSSLPDSFRQLTSLLDHGWTRAGYLWDAINLRFDHFCCTHLRCIIASNRVGLITLLTRLDSLEASIVWSSCMWEHLMFVLIRSHSQTSWLQAIVLTIHTVCSLTLARLDIPLRSLCNLAYNTIGEG